MAVVAPGENLAYLQSLVPKIFDFEGNFDVSTFDELITTLYHSKGPENEFAKKVLEEFLQDDRAWCRVDAILEFSRSDESRFYALLILERLVKTRWKLLPNEQRIGIRDYVLQQIVTVGSTDVESRRLYLNKLVSTLVEILKFEWPRRWPEFIDKIVEISKLSENLCLVNMRILRLLGEEIFQFSTQMNHLKTKYLRDALCGKFGILFNHIHSILTESTEISLINETLKTFTGFMPFIPVSFVFETSIIQVLLERLLKEPMFSNDVLSCLAEAMILEAPTHNRIKLTLFANVLDKMKGILPYEFDFNLAFSNGSDVQQRFLRVLSLFFAQSLRDYHALFAPNYEIQPLIDGLKYILAATKIDDPEIFKITIEFWKSFTSTVRIDKLRIDGRMDSNTKRILDALTPVLSDLRYIVVTHMKRPQEVVIYVNDHGEVVRQLMRDTDATNIYGACKDTLINLTHLDPDEVRKIILDRLDTVMIAPNFSWHDLNCVGWAVGSISDSMNASMERDFLVRVLKNLLSLCDEKKGKDNKAIIASNIMYVVQQYPRFLRPHYRFLKTVVNKLFEFMAETHEGVQDMASDAFLKIAQSCRIQLARPQSGETQSYLDDIIPTLHQALNLLNLHQLETVYEGLGQIVASVDDLEKAKSHVIGCLSNYFHMWNTFDAKTGVNLTDIDSSSIQQQSQFFKIATAFCRSLSFRFDELLSRIYQPMLRIYSGFSGLIAQSLSNFGPDAAYYSDVKVMRSFKRDALNLISCFVINCHDHQEIIKVNYFLPFVNIVLTDYLNSSPLTREAEVLELASNFIKSLKMRLHEHIVTIFRHLFDSTLSMINQDMQEYPEHRINFFRLIEAIASSCFPALATMNEQEFDFIMQALFYAISHTTPNVSSIGLGITIIIFKNLLDSALGDVSFSARFYKSYFISIFDRILHLSTDGMHSSDLAEHSFILSHMLNLLESEKITMPLCGSPSGNINNISFIKEHAVLFLKQQHDHLQQNQIVLFVDGMFCFHRNHDQFVQHIKDFIITIKEYQGQDNDDLFTEELRKEMNEAAKKLDPKRFADTNDYKKLQDYHTIS